MGENSGIQWTHHTFNPWLGCTKVSPACDNCYAERGAARIGAHHGLKLWDGDRYFTGAKYWREPLRWNREAIAARERRRVFCASFADVFEPPPPMGNPYRARLYTARDELFRLIEATPGLDWLLLTKRPEEIRPSVPTSWIQKWPQNAWVGTTVEAPSFMWRVTALLEVPAFVRFVSYEPALERVDFTTAPWSYRVAADHFGEAEIRRSTTINPLTGWWEGQPDGPASAGVRGLDVATKLGVDCGFAGKIKWVIVGGESGPRARPFAVEWAREVVAQCRTYGAAPFVKQLGAASTEGGKPLVLAHAKGADPAEWPEDLRVREFPTGGWT